MASEKEGPSFRLCVCVGTRANRKSRSGAVAFREKNKETHIIFQHRGKRVVVGSQFIPPFAVTQSAKDMSVNDDVLLDT
jgi:hypothetical protein